MNFKNSNIYRKLYQVKRNIIKSIRHSRPAFYFVALYHKYLVLKLKNKPKINTVFLVLFDSVWKYDALYHLMVKDERFNPTILVIPYTQYGDETMLKNLNQTYSYFRHKGYNVVNSMMNNDEWVDVKTVLCPDIVFFTVPYDYTLPQYRIYNFLDTLTCYVPYSFQVSSLYEMQFNQLFHNQIWKNFYETEIHKKIAQKYAKNKATNVVISGYPGCDQFLDLKYYPRYVWKNNSLVRLIWAPHHTILKSDDEFLPYSNFLRYYKLILEIAESKDSKIQVAFKPHPLLKQKLYSEEIWGKEKTDNYFSRWEKSQNGFLEEGNYVDLFITSDAIIHDSGSFIAEYLHLNKPSIFCVKSKKTFSYLNEFGKLALKNYYLVYDELELIEVLNNVLISKTDRLKEKRTKFIQKFLINKTSKTPSQYILNYIKSL